MDGRKRSTESEADEKLLQFRPHEKACFAVARMEILVVEFQIHTMRTNLPKTLDQLIFGKYTLNLSKFTKYLVNVLKFTKYLVNSYHQKDVKHYVLTN